MYVFQMRRKYYKIMYVAAGAQDAAEGAPRKVEDANVGQEKHSTCTVAALHLVWPSGEEVRAREKLEEVSLRVSTACMCTRAVFTLQ